MSGLTKEQIEYRINNNMINNKNIKNSRSIKSIFISNILTIFNLINVILFILILTTGKIRNGTFIIAICINMIIGIYQEIKAKKIIDKLKITKDNKITVIRCCKLEKINKEELLLDDLMYLEQGDNLVVDGKIIKTNNCEVDESIITGESNAIIKKENDTLISGSVIISGNCYAKVTSINNDTYANKLIKEASAIDDNSSYLKNNINSILKVVTVLIIPIGLMLFITQFIYGNQSYSESVLSSVAGIIGMVPDGLVLLTSISLTVGVIKMAKKQVIIQKLNGIELLSCIDILCLDKTGTITDGTMEVEAVIELKKNNDLNKIISTITNELVNNTDIALNKYFKTNEKMDLINKIPFSSSRKYTLIETKSKIYALGALEYITDKKIKDYNILKKYIEKGYRIVTLIEGKKEFNKNNNEIIAFIIIKDNIRKNAKETINFFKEQGVDIKIISGDNPITVSNILKQIEVENSDKFISGQDLPEEFNEIKKIVNKYTIFGRVTPKQKQNIIKALKENNTVGMVGDGVNDILALKESDCGIALATGISAARSVSEVVLTDTDFGILPSIVNEGRRVVNNIERVASMYLIKTIYSFLISLLCIFLKYEYPFYPIQLTLISTACVGLPSFFLALEPNYTKVEKGFLVKVFRNALPSGFCVCLNIFILFMITDIFNIDYELFRLVAVAITGFLNIRLLYKISIPLTPLRKILVILCSSLFYLLLILLPNFLLIKEYNFISFVIFIAFIFIDINIVELFENIYDKIVLYIKRVKEKKYGKK